MTRPADEVMEATDMTRPMVSFAARRDRKGEMEPEVRIMPGGGPREGEEKGGREVEAGRGWWGSYARRKRLRQGVAWWARGGEGEGRESRQ
eukprot:scaffold11332_cov94-Isochrysis_galbana.AAC.1